MMSSQSENRSVLLGALGTSLTARGDWLDALGKSLAQQLALPVRTVNMGGIGQTSSWGRTQAAAMAALQPDIVLIEFSANDAALARGISVAASCRAMQEIVTLLQQALPACAIWLLAMNPVFGLRGLLRPRIARYVEAHRSLAGKIGVQYVDLGPQWRLLGRDELHRAIPDGLHPLPEAARRIIVPTLLAAILADRARTGKSSP